MTEIIIRKHPNARLGWEVERPLWRSGIRSIVGVDEAGRGPLAGPVVAAAVCFSLECCQKLPKELHRLDDSKRLDHEVRSELFEPIQKYADAVGVGIVGPEEIDRINILRATMRAMTIAVEMLREKLSVKGLAPEMLLVDGNYFRTELQIPFQTVIGGDGLSPHIAAASVIAKVTRDRIMEALDVQYPQYAFAQHKGYATELHCQAIRKYGRSEVHRKSFNLSEHQPSLDLFLENDVPLVVSEFEEQPSSTEV